MAHVAVQSKESHDQFSWERPPLRDPYLRLNIRRSTLIAFVGSLIVHALVLFVVPQQRVGLSEPPASNGHRLVADLRPRLSARTAPAPVVAAPETPPQAHAVHGKKALAPSILAVNQAPVKNLDKPSIPPVSTPPAAMPMEDMQSYVNAARARRRNAGLGGTEEAPGQEQQPSEDEIRMAIVKRNLNPGTNGVFQILSMDSRRAAFSFRGWNSDSSNSQREYIQVEIGANSNIELAIVRRMIELIRKYYKGNFNWESQRLDRVVILSARTEDNNGLEEFMLKEFFGERSRISQVR